MPRSRSSAGVALAVLGLAGCGLFHPAAPASCPADRTVVLASQSDVVAFQTCLTARGIALRTGATVDVAPLHVTTITGDLVIGPTVGVEAVSLSELRAVDGAIVVMGNGSLHGLFLPRLERAGRIVVEGNVSLASIAMPRLAEVTGGMTISDNHDLEILDAPALVQVGGDLVLVNHPQLTIVELGALRSAAAVRFDALPKLAAEVLDGLRARASPR